MIIQDTREQDPFDFSMYGVETAIKKLDTGDYTFTGAEDILCIERKRSVNELALNIGKDWTRFSKELERMKLFEHKYIICEFPSSEIEEYPHIPSIPYRVRKYIKIGPKYIFKMIDRIRSDYDVIFFFCSSKSEAEQRVIELYEQFKKRS